MACVWLERESIAVCRVVFLDHTGIDGMADIKKAKPEGGSAKKALTMPKSLHVLLVRSLCEDQQRRLPGQRRCCRHPFQSNQRIS